MNTGEEIWKPVPIAKYAHYEVSSLGNIRHSKIKINKKFGCVRGYSTVSFASKSSNDGVPTTLSVHRIVAIAFIPNPENKREVNHKNLDRGDNRVCNLEWATSSENLKHAYLNGRYKPPQKRGAKNRLSKPFTQHKLDGTVIATWESLGHANRVTGLDMSCISACLNGRAKTYAGFLWKRSI